MHKLYIIVGLTVAAALSLALALVTVTPFDLGWQAFVGLIVFLIINIIADTHPLHLSPGKVQLTISGLSSYALLALFPPLYAGLAASTSTLIVQSFFNKKPLVKRTFNAAQLFVSIACAGIIYHYIIAVPLHIAIPNFVAAAFCSIVVYFLLNTSLVSLAVSALNDLPFWRTWSGNFRWELIYMLGSVPLAVLLIVAYQRLWIAGPLLFIAPLFLLRESYAQYVRLRTTYRETVRMLVKIIETHDTYTAGHSLRVAEYATRLASVSKVPGSDVEKIEIAAYLHDLGKVDLAITHLVRKPGKLTADERRRIQLHPIVSADLASQVTFFKGDIEKIILHHHEHFNGSGYPHGLSGTSIPLGSRIILIADAFDAMTSNRMYRSALDLDQVKEEFRKYAGIQFDPELVPLFINYCVRDMSMVIPQVEIAYDDLLSTKARQSVLIEDESGDNVEESVPAASHVI